MAWIVVAPCLSGHPVPEGREDCMAGAHPRRVGHSLEACAYAHSDRTSAIVLPCVVPRTTLKTRQARRRPRAHQPRSRHRAGPRDYIYRVDPVSAISLKSLRADPQSGYFVLQSSAIATLLLKDQLHDVFSEVFV